MILLKRCYFIEDNDVKGQCIQTHEIWIGGVGGGGGCFCSMTVGGQSKSMEIDYSQPNRRLENILLLK